MKVFLTGGTGFIGSHLARQLIARGDRVTALVRKPADAAWLKELGADLAPGDITIKESLRDPMKGADVVHHVAAWYEIGALDESKMHAINVRGTVNVLKTAGELGVPNIVYCSTVAALGPNRNGIGDESQQNDGRFRSFYEKTKWAAHEEARRLIGEGIPVKIALPSAVYGPADKSLIGLTCQYFVKGWVRALAFQDSRLTFTHVDDTADGLRLVADKGRVGEEYIIAGQVLSLTEWMRLMASVTGLPEPKWIIPEKLVRKLLPLTAPIMRWAGLPPRLHLEGLAMTGSWAFTSEKARRELGWNPRPAETGFAETLEWYRLKHSPHRVFTIRVGKPTPTRRGGLGRPLRTIGKVISSHHLSDYERNVLLTISRATLPSIGALPPGGSETVEKVERFLTGAGTATFWVYRTLLWVIELSAIIPTGRRFSRLPADMGEKWLVRWTAGPAVTRAVLMAVSTPIKVAHFDDPRIYEHFGRVHDRRSQQVERPRYMDQVTAGRDLPADETIECDVVVVGTGAGGAVVAKELAEAGLAVVMLEEGDFFTRKDFSGRLWDAQRMLYRDKGFTVTLGNTVIPVPMGVTVGGSTTVNTGTCWRTPEWILNRWVNDHGLDELTPDRLAPQFDRVEKILRIQPATPEQVGAVGRVIARGCDALGWTHLPVNRNAPECDGSGVCNFGCPIDARLSMDLSYVPLALKSASVLFTRVRADRVWIENGRAAGVMARTRDGGKNVRFRSRAVVLACGAIMTPYFLLRQGICNRSGLVGRNLSIHPAVGAAALFDEEIKGYAATPQGYCVNQFHKDGILLLGASVPIDVAAAQFMTVGRELMETMEAYDRVATFGGMVEDPGVGRVRPGPGGRPLMTYSVNAETLDKLKRAAAAIARIFLRAGAKWVHPHVQRAPALRSDSDVDAFLRSPWKARDFILTAYHPLGTCRMGIDPLKSVVNQDYESHDIPGLFIADGSVMPSSVAVNPQETIMAMATRAAERIAGKLT